MQQVDELANWVHSDLWPDLTVLLDAPVEVGMSRANQRGEPDRFEIEKSEFFARVRTCYLDLAAREPQRFEVVDASRSLAEVTAHVERIAARFLSASLR
jgi:dTMP kinase